MKELDVLFEKIQQKGISVSEVARIIDIPQDRLYQWRNKRGKPKGEDFVKIQKWVNDEAVPEPPKEPAAMSMDAILKLIETNSVLAQSNKDVSASNKILAEANQKLADRVLSTTPTVSVDPQIQKVLAARQKRLLELVGEIATGKKFQSKKEFLAALSNIDLSITEKEILEGIQID